MGTGDGNGLSAHERVSPRTKHDRYYSNGTSLKL